MNSSDNKDNYISKIDNSNRQDDINNHGHWNTNPVKINTKTNTAERILDSKITLKC